MISMIQQAQIQVTYHLVAQSQDCSFYLQAQDLFYVFLLAALLLPRLPALGPDVLCHFQDFLAQLILEGDFLHKMEEVPSDGGVAGQHLEDRLGVGQALLTTLHVPQALRIPTPDPLNKHLEDGLGSLGEKQFLVLLVGAALSVGGAPLAVLGLLRLMLITLLDHGESIGKSQKLVAKLDNGDLHQFPLPLLAVMVLNEGIYRPQTLLHRYLLQFSFHLHPHRLVTQASLIAETARPKEVDFRSQQKTTGKQLAPTQIKRRL